MRKQLTFTYQSLDQLYRISQGKDKDFQLIETIDREKGRPLRGECWFILKQQSNGLIFRFVMENDVEGGRAEGMPGRRPVSIRVFNKLHTRIYKQQSRQVRQTLFGAKYFAYGAIILTVSGLLLVGWHKLLETKTGPFDLGNAAYFKFPFLLVFWGVMGSQLKNTEKDTDCNPARFSNINTTTTL
jgi:hypothetical protein